MKDFKKIFLVFVSCALFAANIPICAFAQETNETLTAPNIDTLLDYIDCS